VAGTQKTNSSGVVAYCPAAALALVPTIRWSLAAVLVAGELSFAVVVGTACVLLAMAALVTRLLIPVPPSGIASSFPFGAPISREGDHSFRCLPTTTQSRAIPHSWQATGLLSPIGAMEPAPRSRRGTTFRRAWLHGYAPREQAPNR
jgi:hypothetical protein